ncbi:hypothetical protein F4823DRAFT_592408 [Ustulina deusta]|nr:hypothetical protein F4823DRAFT_592408 [Ustulina deusta]
MAHGETFPAIRLQQEWRPSSGFLAVLFFIFMPTTAVEYKRVRSWRRPKVGNIEALRWRFCKLGAWRTSLTDRCVHTLAFGGVGIFGRVDLGRKCVEPTHP